MKGQLLLDSGQLRGSFFQRTVVLICQHDAEGAFGLVLNRATGNNVGEMIVADLPEALKELPALSGRPGAAFRAEFSALGRLHSRRQRDAESEPGPFARLAGRTRRVALRRPGRSRCSPATPAGARASSKTR